MIPRPEWEKFEYTHLKDINKKKTTKKNYRDCTQICHNINRNYCISILHNVKSKKNYFQKVWILEKP